MTDSTGIPNNISASFQQLKEAAIQLNAVSDTLSAPIEKLNVSLQRLNLGVEAWTQYAGNFDDDTGYYWAHEIGYAKIESKWGIAVRRRSGDANHQDDEDYEVWLFNDAPRALRVEAIDHLPALFDALVKAARDTANRIMAKIGQAEQFADAITGVRPAAATSKRK